MQLTKSCTSYTTWFKVSRIRSILQPSYINSSSGFIFIYPPRKNWHKKTWLSKPTKAPLICGIASRSWSASKAFAQDRQHQEGLKVGTDLAVFSKDLHLEVSKVWGEEPWEVVTFMFRPPYQPISLPPESFPNVSPMRTPCLSLLWKLRS